MINKIILVKIYFTIYYLVFIKSIFLVLLKKKKKIFFFF